MPYLISPETRVNSYVLSRQSAPETVALIGGGYVTVWSGAGPTDAGYSVYLQRYDVAGVRLGEEVLVNTTGIYSQQNPAVTALASGGYAVTWHSIVPGGGSGDASSLGVFVRTFDAAGIALGTDVQVSGQGSYQQIAALPGGGFVVWWTHAADYPFSAVSAQLYNAEGRPEGPSFVLDQDREATLANIVATDAGFMAVWQASSDSGATIAIQSFGENGARLGETVRIPRDDDTTKTEIVRLADGGFALVWHEADGLWAQILADDARPSGDRFLVQAVWGGAGFIHSVVATPDGGFAVAWERFAGATQTSITVATFWADGTPNAGPISIQTGISTPGDGPGLAVLPSGDLIVTYSRYVGDIPNYYDVFEMRLSVQSGLITGSDSNERLVGSLSADQLIGLDGDDTLIGLAGNDTLNGGGGSDVLDGGAGMDTAVYAGVRLQYSASSTSVSGGPEGGTDTLTSIEELRFIDGVLSFDVDGAAAQVMRLYDAALDRLPDRGGLEGYTRHLQTGAINVQQLATILLNSAEFQARYGALSNQAFIEQMYRFCLNREGDPGGIAAWTGNLNAGMSRDSVLLRFSESAEHRALTASALAQGLWVPDQEALAIARLYDAAFNRLPDPGGLAAWTAILEGGRPLIDIAAAFASSAEFQARYGTTLPNQAFVEQIYRASLDREGDPEGIAAWTKQMDLGMSRAAILLAFSESTEHVALTAPRWSGGIRFEGYAPATSTATLKIEDVAVDPAPASSLDAQAPAYVPQIEFHVRDDDQMLEHASNDDFIPLPSRTFEGQPAWQVRPLVELGLASDLIVLSTPELPAAPTSLAEGTTALSQHPEPDYWLH